MRLHNKHGTPVDPVPFLVVIAMAFATSFSFGPMYFVALGWSLPAGVAGSATAFLLAAAATYYRLVWTYRPARRREVPAATRLRRLAYSIVVIWAALVLLALPLLQ